MFSNECHYHIKLSTGITTTISLAISICVLFILLMQLVNELLSISFLLALFGAAAVPVFGIDIVPLTCMYASL